MRRKIWTRPRRQSRKENEEKTNEEIKGLKFKLLSMDVYQHRENLGFYGIPETESAENGDTKMILGYFLDDVLDLTNARSVSYKECNTSGKRQMKNREIHTPSRPRSRDGF